MPCGVGLRVDLDQRGYPDTHQRAATIEAVVRVAADR
jgi:hypothetical protein